MPNRIIKESICTSDSVDGLSWFEEVFFYRLIVNCDDFGRFDARPAVLKSRLFPLKERITLKEVSNALTKLANADIVRLYECDSKPYLYLPTWEVHQTPRAKKSKYPDPAECVNTSEIICKQIQANAPDNRDTIIDNRYSINENDNTRVTAPDSDKKEKPNDVFAEFAKDNENLLCTLRDFEKMRNRIKKPLTDRAKNMLITKLKKDFAPREWVSVLEQSISRCWADVYPIKTATNSTETVPKSHESHTVPSKHEVEQMKKFLDSIKMEGAK